MMLRIAVIVIISVIRMNKIFKNSLKICAALALFALAPTAQAQPITQSNPRLSVAIIPNADAKPLITLHASETSASAILSLLAAKTGAKIFVKSDALVDSLELKRVPLPDAIAQIAQAANLKFEKPMALSPNNTYTVGEFKSLPTRLDMDFKDIAVSQLVKILNEQFHIGARVDPSVPEKIIDITVFNVSAIEALQTIADAADLEVSKTANGTVLQERADKKSLTFRDIPTSQLFHVFSEQFGIKIRLAPNLPNKTIDINLSGMMTPEEALKATAKAADFDLTEIDGVYVVRERAATAK